MDIADDTLNHSEVQQAESKMFVISALDITEMSGSVFFFSISRLLNEL